MYPQAGWLAGFIFFDRGSYLNASRFCDETGTCGWIPNIYGIRLTNLTRFFNAWQFFVNISLGKRTDLLFLCKTSEHFLFCFAREIKILLS